MATEVFRLIIVQATKVAAKSHSVNAMPTHSFRASAGNDRQHHSTFFSRLIDFFFVQFYHVQQGIWSSFHG